jgi:hypothetical protein
MSPESFAYWLTGFRELSLTDEPPTKEQWKLICEHLDLVFRKVTPKLDKGEYKPQKNCFNLYNGIPDEALYC